MPHIKIEAPAKLNLHLQAGERRPDGFHGIESLFLALAFGDILCLETLREPLKLEICMDWQFCGCQSLQNAAPTLPPEKNIVFRAVSLFRDRTGYDAGLRVSVEKHIPLGGGLGGGSSDAAATLLALNRLALADGKTPLDGVSLAEMGASLGSDIPFFLENALEWPGAAKGAAWVSGRGEKVHPVAVPEPVRGLFWVLVNPGFASDTAKAYRLLDEYRPKAPPFRHSSEILPFFAGHPRNWPFENDFLPIFLADAENSPASDELSSVYPHIISHLRDLGAEFAGLSGSGSSCFGVFTHQAGAELARESLLKHWPFVHICGT